MKFALLLLSAVIISNLSYAQDSAPAADPVVSEAPSTTSPVDPATPPASAPKAQAEDAKKGDPKIIKMIEDKFKISAEEIAKLRSDKIGYGQIILMAEFTKASGKSMEEIATMFKEKKSAKEVAKELKLTKEDMDKIRQDMKPLREERKERKEEHKDKKDDKKDERRQDRKEDRKTDRPKK